MQGGLPANIFCENFIEPPPSPMMKEYKLIERTGDDNCLDAKVYYKMKLPMMSDRDLVIQVHQEKKDDGSYWGYASSIEHPDYPTIKNVVRMYSLTYFKVSEESDGILNYTEISNFDLKGYLPASLMNMIMSSEVEKEFRALYNHLVKVSKERKDK